MSKPSKQPRATIRDVARVTGVSIKTVSRVVSGQGYVSERTRRQVERGVQKLGYVPNKVASSLASGRTKSIGMVIPDIASVHFAEIALGAENAATQAGYQLMLSNTTGSQEKEKQVLSHLHQVRVDGVIVAGARLPDDALLQGLGQYPAFVSIDHPLISDHGGNIVSEHAKGTALAVEHLAQSQRQEIAFIAGPKNSYSAAERLRGFLQAMKKLDREVLADLIVKYETNYGDEFPSQWEWFNATDVGSAQWNERRALLGSRGAYALLAAHPEIDALVCFDDQTAFGALRACAQLGRRVPDDVAIIGCNDIPLAIQVTPTLTTQRIPRYQIGKRAVEMLLGQLHGAPHPAPVVFPHELIIRESAPAFSSQPKPNH
jgi:LacI family transcriptional regulator